MTTRVYGPDGEPLDPQNGEFLMRKHTHVGIALDRSGSMAALKKQTISGFNEHLETIKTNASKGGDTRVSLVTFGGDIKIEFTSLAAHKIRPLTQGAYKPHGSTPMYDAIGILLNELEEYDVHSLNVAFLVLIISDGEENSSTRFGRNDIARRIQRLKATGRWTFAYIGANQNLYEIENTWYIPAHNWTYTPAGTARVYGVMSVCTSDYFAGREQGLSNVANYFSPSQTTEGSEIIESSVTITKGSTDTPEV